MTTEIQMAANLMRLSEVEKEEERLMHSLMDYKEIALSLIRARALSYERNKIEGGMI